MVVGEALLTIKSTDSASSAGREAQLNHSGCNCYLPLNCQQPPPHPPTPFVYQLFALNRLQTFVGELNGPGTLISVLNMSRNTYQCSGQAKNMYQCIEQDTKHVPV